MARSKRDPNRKEKLLKYKKSKSLKKMAKRPEQNLRQVPNWQSTENFTLTGVELEALYNFYNLLAPGFTAIQQIFSRGVQAGKIKIGYEREDGSAVSDEEVAAYTKQLNEYFKEKMKVKDESGEIKASETATGSESAKIVELNPQVEIAPN
jgi:hypothetical protein